ncbi:MAG: hypothetical protein M1839_009451 [Geoglossum umbratile]|nr:MAG: hypothetical protein M1839_009451 [Geoglossum umbratile]
MAITNGHSDDSAAFSQLLSAAAEAADVIHSSPMAAAVDHSSVSRGASDASAAIGGQTHETLRSSDVRPRNGQVPGGSVTMVVNGAAGGERLHKRRKVALACDGCRERKTRCDGERPICGSCKRRSRQPGQCVYKTETIRVSVADGSIEALHNRIRELETRYRIDGSSPASSHHVPPSSASHAVDMAESPTLPPPGQDHSRAHSSRTISVDHILATPWQPMQNGSGEYGPQPRPGGATTNGHRPARSLTLTSQSGPPQSQNGGNLTVPESPDVDDGRPASRRASDGQDHGHKSPTHAIGTVPTANGKDPVVDRHVFSSSLTASLMKQVGSATYSGAGHPDGHTYLQPAHLAPTTASSGLAVKPVRPNPIAMLCEERPSLKLEDYALPPRPFADHLISQYWTMCATLYPFLHKPTFYLAYEMLWASDRENIELVVSPGAGLGNATDGGPDTSIFYCALNTMFAIGCQFSDIPIKDRSRVANTFFQRSKQLLHLDILSSGSISLVQTLLLVTQYLQCTPYPTRCWNSVGIASRVAQGLGLHLEKSAKRLPSLELEVRRRTWYGCETLEMVVSMTLGRPATTPYRSSVPLPTAIDDEYLEPGAYNCVQPADEFSRLNFFVEAIKLYKILGNILSSVYEPWIDGAGRMGSDPAGFEHLQSSKGFDMIMSLDSALMRFQSEVPALLKSPNSGVSTSKLNSEDPDTLKRQANVLHARYLHLRILLYRPIFTQLCRSSNLTSQTAEPTSKPSADGLANKSEGTMTSFFATRCAVSCVNAATELINFINKNTGTRATGAWWYNMFYTHTAGMVLIMASICVPIQAFLDMAALEESWKNCQDALGRMASYSATATRCLKGLQSLHARVCSKDIARKANPSKPFSPTTNGTALSGSANGSAHHRSNDPTDVVNILNTEKFSGQSEPATSSEIGDDFVCTAANERGGAFPLNIIDGAWWNGPTFDCFIEGTPGELDPGL